MTVEKIAISVIVPVYNAASFLDECISTILKQSFPSFELICVDDGSGDDSLTILSSYAEKDSRIKIIQQKNQGAGAARNLGLQNATGKYVLFLDADDFFEQDMFLNLFRTAEAKDADIVVCNADEYDTENMKYYSPTFIYYCPGVSDFFSASDIEDYIFNFTVPAPWNKLFRREFILEQGILFQNIKSTNDLFFVYSALSCCSRIAVLDEVLVHYRVNNNNSLQGNIKKDIVDVFRALAYLKEFLQSKGLFLRYNNSFNSLVGNEGVYTLANIPADRFKQQVKSSELQKKLSMLLETKVYNEISNYKGRIFVYGAGQTAIVLVRCLVELAGIEKKCINVVVSSVNGNQATVCNIPVVEINKCNITEECKVIICSPVESSRQAMKKNAIKMGYNDVILFNNIDVLKCCYLFGSKY